MFSAADAMDVCNGLPEESKQNASVVADKVTPEGRARMAVGKVIAAAQLQLVWLGVEQILSVLSPPLNSTNTGCRRDIAAYCANRTRLRVWSM